MKKNSLLFLVLILIIGSLAYAKFRPANKISIDTSSDSPTEMMSEASKFAKAVESGQPYTCKIDNEDASMTYQIKDGKMYMTTTTPEYNGFMINNMEYIYSWSDQSDQGSMMKIPTEEEVAEIEETLPSPDNTPTSASEFDYQSFEQEGYTINCEQGGVDDAVFTPPDSITFIDPTAMMEQSMPEEDAPSLQELQEMAKEYQAN